MCFGVLLVMCLNNYNVFYHFAFLVNQCLTFFRTTPSKFKHMTSKVLIQSGFPTLYQLTLEKKVIGTLTKHTLGKRNPSKVNKTILLVGEAGAGKSTLLNALVNYAMGVKWEDNLWFEAAEDERYRQSESQTSDVNIYEIFGFEGVTLPYSLTIIDTPGFGCTKTSDHDESIIKRLLECFRSKNGVQELNVVGLVMKSTDNRLNDRLKHVFDSVMSLFGKDVEKKLVALITNCHGNKPKNCLKALEAANVKYATDDNNQPVYFLFDNNQKEERTEDTEVLKRSFDVSMKGLRHFSEFLNLSGPQEMMTTVAVLRERTRLTACIQNLQERIKDLELQQTEIQQCQEALRKCEQEMKNNENFTVEVDERFKEKENISGGLWGLLFYKGATCCTVCEENCHHPGCNMSWYPNHCEVMTSGHCTSCAGKCPASAHVKGKWIYVSKTRTLLRTRQDMKRKYEENKTGGERQLSLLENLNKKINGLVEEKDKCLEECYKLVMSLKEIALQGYTNNNAVYLDLLIEKMKEKGDTEKLRKLEEINS